MDDFQSWQYVQWTLTKEVAMLKVGTVARCYELIGAEENIIKSDRH